jgi:hypothetical protein
MWGVLAKAVERFDCELYAAHLLSTHASYLIGFYDAATHSKFKQWLHGNWAREANIRRNREGSVWGRRARSIQVVGEAALIERLNYNLSNGTKEGLVSSPELWPGLHAAKSLCTGEPAEGDWIDRSEYWQNRRARNNVTLASCTKAVFLTFSKLPCWRNLTDSEYQARMQQMCAQIAEEHKRPNRPTPFVSPELTKTRAWRRRQTRLRNRTGCSPEEVGAGTFRESDAENERRRAPDIHTDCSERRAAYRAAYVLHVSGLKAARALLEAKLGEIQPAGHVIASPLGPVSVPPPT